MSLIDRARTALSGAVEFAEMVAPEWGLRREHARQKTAAIRDMGYSQHGASRSSKWAQGWTTARGGPDADITLNLDLLRQRSRDLCMGEPLAIGALKTIRANEVGSGLLLNSQIDAEYLGLSDDQALEWEAHTEREFASWAGTLDCDAAQRCNFGEMVALARLSEMMSGDVFALLPSIPRKGQRYDLRVQLIEADRVSDPWPYPVGHNVLGGVEVGDYGEPVAYYVAKVHPGDLFLPGTYGGYGAFAYGAVTVPPMIEGGIYGAQWNHWDRVPAFGAKTGRRMVLHLMDSDRPGQRRGVPVLAPVMERMKQLSRYQNAEVTAAVVSGMFTAAITSERPDYKLGQSVPPEQQVQVNDSQPENTYQLAPGSVVTLLPGEKLEAVDPSRPNRAFDDFVKAVCRYIGVGLGLPYPLLVLEFDGSYNSSRAAVIEAWKRFTVGRSRMAKRFCQPIYEQWLEEAVAKGYVKAPGFFSDPLIRAAWCGAEWTGPSQGQLNPVYEVEAAEKRVEGGFSTRTQETAMLTGSNWERNHRVRVREERLRREGQVATNPSTSTADDPPAVEADSKTTKPTPKKEAA